MNLCELIFISYIFRFLNSTIPVNHAKRVIPNIMNNMTLVTKISEI